MDGIWSAGLEEEPFVIEKQKIRINTRNLEIYSRYIGGETNKELAKVFQLSPSRISGIIKTIKEQIDFIRSQPTRVRAGNTTVLYMPPSKY